MARRLAVALGLAALGIIWLTEFTDIDMRLARAAFDPVLGDFPLRHAFLLETVGHRYMRRLFVLAGACVLGIVLVDLRFDLLDTWARIRMRALALCAVLVPLTVSLLKGASSLSCPWDLQAFKGSQPYFRLLDAIPAGASGGHCWPGGHASGSLWLLGLVVFWLPYRPRRAAIAGVSLLGIGLGVGWVQQLRGAHFLSHTLWSMWIAAAITGAVWYWMLHRNPHQFVPRQRGKSYAAATWTSAHVGEVVDGSEHSVGTGGQAFRAAAGGAGETRAGNSAAGRQLGGDVGGGTAERRPGAQDRGILPRRLAMASTHGGEEAGLCGVRDGEPGTPARQGGASG